MNLRISVDQQISLATEPRQILESFSKASWPWGIVFVSAYIFNGKKNRNYINDKR